MCFDLDSRPPIPPIAGGALASRSRTLRSEDGAAYRAFEAQATKPSGAAILILPDVRGLHPYYEELALRFAEHGVDALAIDYFGRSAGTDRRNEAFDHAPHIDQVTWKNLAADIATAARSLREQGPDRAGRLFTIGFCFGGRLAFMSATLGLGLEGAIGFYGWPVGERRGVPAPTDCADRLDARVLAIFGGADPGIPATAVAAFEKALLGAGVDHRVITYPDAPHSFFDRKAAEFADASRRAWDEVLGFVRAETRALA